MEAEEPWPIGSGSSAGTASAPRSTADALKVVRAAGVELDTVDYDLGGRRYLATGEVLPDAVLEELRGFDAILLGAVGTPEVPPGVLERGLLLKMRFALDLYVNLRPFKAGPDRHNDGVDFLVVRENTEGTYAGEGGFLRHGTPHEIATQGSVNTRMGVERCVRFAFELARSRATRKHLTLVHKTNVLTFAGDLWQRTFDDVAAEFPDVADRVQPRRRRVHLLRAGSRPLRRDRHRQPLRRHPHRPRRRDRRRHRPGRVRQPQPGPHRPVAVRAGARLGARHRRHRPGRPPGGRDLGRHDVRFPG